MTFRTGFVVTQQVSLSDWRLENAVGKPLVGSVRTPRRADPGMMLEIDTQRGRARVPFGRGVYLATNLTLELRCSIVNLAEGTVKAIDAIMKAQDADLVARAASSWIEHSQRFWWTRKIPWQLAMMDLANGQSFRVVRVTDRELFFVMAEDPGPIEWVVLLGDIHLDDVGFDDGARGGQGHGAGLSVKDSGHDGGEAAPRLANERLWSVAS